MDIRSQSSMLLLAVSTCLGVLLGGITWLVLYASTSTKALELDVAGFMLSGLSMVLGGSIAAGAAIAYWVRKHRPARKRLMGGVVVCVLAGGLSCALIGGPIIEYAQKHYSYSICNVSDFCE